MDFGRIYNYRIDCIISFVAVAHHGGFSAAAKALYRSQPRVSSHVADLEQELGTLLLDRSGHPARLTPEGRALLPHAEEILWSLAVLRSDEVQTVPVMLASLQGPPGLTAGAVRE